MALSDLVKLIRHYLKLVLAIPAICVIVSILVTIVIPTNYEAKATLLTNGDIALASGYAQNEAITYSQNGIKVLVDADNTYRTITITAEGNDYGGCIAAANATVLAAADDYRQVNNAASISTNEATYAEAVSDGGIRTTVTALFVGIIIALCFIVLLDLIKTPIKSKSDIETTTDLPVLGVIPNRDRSERLLANVRFLSDDQFSTIAIVPIGYTGAALTCAELSSAFERSGIAVARIQGNPHAESFNAPPAPGFIRLIECAPLSEGIGAVYVAKAADITIFCVSEWIDSRKALQSVVEEFRFAKVSLGGVVLLTRGYSK